MREILKIIESSQIPHTEPYLKGSNFIFYSDGSFECDHPHFYNRRWCWKMIDDVFYMGQEPFDNVEGAHDTLMSYETRHFLSVELSAEIAIQRLLDEQSHLP